METDTHTGIATDVVQGLVAKDDSEQARSPLNLGIAADSDYHRVSPGCPKGYTQQCGMGYRT